MPNETNTSSVSCANKNANQATPSGSQERSPEALKAARLCKVDELESETRLAKHYCDEMQKLEAELKAEQAKVAALREKHAACAAIRDEAVLSLKELDRAMCEAQTNGCPSMTRFEYQCLQLSRGLVFKAELMKRNEEENNNKAEAQV